MGRGGGSNRPGRSWIRSPAPPRTLSRADALAELAGRYFRSRGPATVADFSWWSGLPASEARAGLESVRSTLIADVVDGQTYWRAEGPAAKARSISAHLLPAFDEYLVAYRNRAAVLHPGYVKRVNAGGGMLDPCVVVDGEVIGTWRRTAGRREVTIEIDPFEPAWRLPQAISAAAARYGAFLGLDVRIVRAQ